ncbi:hypothetical protein BN130_4156 [Cronobacter malonaticus 507]|nr:hypothetical protein BN130_4156 [Cronobacter malonaticus 507]
MSYLSGAWQARKAEIKYASRRHPEAEKGQHKAANLRKP